EVVDRRIGIGIGLVIDDELLCSITIHRTLDTLFHLLTNSGQFPCRVGRKRIHITICTAAIALATVAIRTSELTVYNNLEYALTAILSPQVSTIMIVRLLPDIEECSHDGCKDTGLS